MDLAETMKNVLAKNGGNGGGGGTASSGGGGSIGAEGYVTEKLYMLLQLYLQNKGWSPSIELLQCFTELKESSMLPSATYLQMMASRVGLDTQGRLILRENGKIILPYEHFANAVMLKHMNGPHGLHLGIEGTVRAVVDSYTIGREQFGMEKEFIIEVVQNCPNPACRYYKNQLEMTQKTIQQHLSQQPTYMPTGGGGLVDSQAVERLLRGAGLPQDFQLPLTPQLAALASGAEGAGETKARPLALQQQSRLLAQQALDKLALAASKAPPEPKPKPKPRFADAAPASAQAAQAAQADAKLSDFLRANFETIESLSGGVSGSVPIVTPAASSTSASSSGPHSQERVVRAFAELARNLHRMRPCVRPAMCKPYGKQSEQLQKILMDTIQLVQSLRSYLPPPHIQVTSWKNDDKLRSGSVDDLTGEQRKIATGN